MQTSSGFCQISVGWISGRESLLAKKEAELQAAERSLLGDSQTAGEVDKNNCIECSTPSPTSARMLPLQAGSHTICIRQAGSGRLRMLRPAHSETILYSSCAD
jgi:hypothetical protein